MAWFTRQKPARRDGRRREEQIVRTEGLWLKCDSCRQIVWRKALDENLQVCPKCDFHFKIDAAARLRHAVSTTASGRSSTASLTSTDPLEFVDSEVLQGTPGRHEEGHLAPGRGHLGRPGFSTDARSTSARSS